jgi:hypothetical protein
MGAAQDRELELMQDLSAFGAIQVGELAQSRSSAVDPPLPILGRFE